MSSNVTNAYVATPPIDGGVFYGADLGTDLPTDAITDLDTVLLAGDHGTIGENGIKIAIKRNTTDKKKFGGGTFLNLQDDFDETMTVMFMEDDNINVVQSVFGKSAVKVGEANAEHGNTKTIYHRAQPLPIRSYVAESVWGEKTKRHVVQFGQIVEIAEINNEHKEITGYEVTIKVYESEYVDGELGYIAEYRDDGQKVEAPAPTPSVKTVTIGAATAGTFTLTVGGQTTAPIAYNATPAAVKAALEALSTVAAGEATVAGSNGGPYTVTLANGAAVTGSGTGLTGGSFGVA